MAFCCKFISCRPTWGAETIG